MTFSDKKTGQLAAYLLNMSGGRMPHLKLMKLLYLADRESLNQYGFTLSHDEAVSMPHGPVLSKTLDLINGSADSSENGWKSLISDKANYEVSLAKDVRDISFDELSEADTEVLSTVWAQYGGMGHFEIRDFTHDYCAEWQDPNGPSESIPLRRVLDALGKNPVEADEIIEANHIAKGVEDIFASL